MNAKPVLMIHEVTPEILELPLHNFVLTFDDGLFSQYHYIDKLLDFKTEMIFFISTGIVCDQPQSFQFPTSRVAHEKAFSGNKEDFMTLEQVIKLSHFPKTRIGAHSHLHKRISSFPKLIDKVQHIEEDTKRVIEWFQENLNTTPTDFCYPYNDDFQGFYKGLLMKYGFKNFYGSERIPVETLLHS